MTPQTFRKKPVEIQAMDVTPETAQAVVDWVNGNGGQADLAGPGTGVIVVTLEGNHLASWSDKMIQGIKGEFYPCKPDIFAATYDEVS